METQSESNKQFGNREADERIAERAFPEATPDPGMQADEVHRIDEAPTGHDVPVEPTPREIQAGANKALALYEEYQGKKLSDGPMDEEAQRILYEIHEERQGWTEAMERDARAALQLLYPDVGGSKVNGPL